RAVQHDVLELNDRGAEVMDIRHSGHKTPLPPTDRSLQIHACHGPVRELEVLHDQLLALFAADPTLTPKDIVVMMPDVNSYGPYIQAVFGKEIPGQERSGKPMIPFAISDRTARQESPLLQSFLNLLRLPHSRLGAGELLAILEVPAVLRRFALDEADFNALRQWVEESGIRWGLDEVFATRFDLPVQTSNSWLFGLRRLLLGFAMGEGAPVADILPYHDIEGQQGAVLGKLAWFVECIANLLPRLQGQQALAHWGEVLQQLLTDFYLPNEDEERQLELIRTTLDNWQTQIDEAYYCKAISGDLLRHYLTQALERTRSSQRFLAGQVNFCTLMPMRSIPFKWVCLLGMNDGLYPRTVPAQGFDLMALAARR
ncbi:MAG: exodeoxyribonuclease V subunit gamma, partial [Aeromonas sp.]